MLISRVILLRFIAASAAAATPLALTVHGDLGPKSGSISGEHSTASIGAAAPAASEGEPSATKSSSVSAAQMVAVGNESQDEVHLKLLSRNSGLALEIPGFATTDGSKAVQWSYAGGKNQQWTFVPKAGGFVQMQNRNSALCLDVAREAPPLGASAIQRACGEDVSQQWQPRKASGEFIELVNRESGLCLDVVNYSRSDSAAVQQWTCHEGSNQQWLSSAIDTTPTNHGKPGGFTYSIERPASPTPDEEDALSRIAVAMAAAVELSNSYSDLQKHLTVRYAPWVSTAWGDSGGGIFFGPHRIYMQEAVALHEIQHTVGIGTYGEFDRLCVNNVWVGVRASTLIKSWDGPDAKITCQFQHISPYGINQPTELNAVSGPRHVKLVTAMNHDMLQPTTAPAITTAELPGGVAGVSYRSSIEVSGEPAPTVSSASTLPEGMQFDQKTRALTGSPKEAGEYELIFRADNGVTPVAERRLILSIKAPISAPAGALQEVVAVPGGATAAGWSKQFGSPTPVTVDLRMGDVSAVRAPTAADGSFRLVVPAKPGARTICANGIGANDLSAPLGCKATTVLGGNPITSVELTRTSSRHFTTRGWAIDGDTTGAVAVRVLIDGKPVKTLQASARRDDIGARFPGYGANHGWNATIGVLPGRHTVCLIAENIGAGRNAAPECKNVSVPR